MAGFLTLLLAVCSAVIAGCAGGPVRDPSTQDDSDKPVYHKDITVVYGNKGRAGAALHMQDNIHVLHVNRNDKGETALQSLAVKGIDEQQDTSPGHDSLYATDNEKDLVAKALETQAQITIKSSQPKLAELANPVIIKKPPQKPQPQKIKPNQKVETAVEAQVHAGASYTVYELARWQRYCEGKPDHLDVAFVVSAGGHTAVPDEMLERCQPAKRL